MPEGNVLVIGGGGFYGRYLVADLVRSTQADILVASRNPPSHWAEPDRVRSVVCDLRDLARLELLAARCDIVVHCAGPFHALPLNPLHAAIRTGTHYVDIAEDRHYSRAVRELEEEIGRAGITVSSGMSVAPAMEALFAEMLRGCFDALVSVRTFAAPDTRKHRGWAMFHTMLTGVGRPFWQPGNGKLRQVRGWTEPEWVEFPPPLGKRLTYLVLEMADLDLLPELLGVKTVEFKAGSEWPFLNRLLGAAARIRTSTGHPDWERFTPILRTFSWLVGRLGKDEGGVIFEIRGLLKGSSITHRIAVVARQDGGLIPAVLASMATARLLSGDLPMKGIVPIHGWIPSAELVRELEARGLEIWWQPHGVIEWQRFDLNDIG
jgi:NAD(P)-dependent dehydrogenase (short-subunit alcohol dehydrogenase family)